MRYLMAGGGTGGHIIPAINIAREILKIDTNAQFLFIGTERGMETKIVPNAGFELKMVEAKPWNGISSLKNLIASSSFVAQIIDDFRCDAVVGTGGYVSAPAIVAAKKRKIPLFIQEQNTFPGLATKLGSLFAKKVFLGFEQAKRFLWRKSRAIFSGNPANITIPNRDRETVRREFGLSPNYRTILITGGSQGASALNETMKILLERSGLPANTQVLWQCGNRGFPALDSWLAGKNFPVVLKPFIDNMALAYLSADIVIARSGALTLAEIAIAKLPAILIPYPHSAGNHQLKNAAVFADAGAAVVIEQKDLTPALLLSSIEEIITNPARMEEMSKSAWSLAKPDAGKMIAREIVEALENERINSLK